MTIYGRLGDNRGCKCALKPSINAAKTVEADAYAELRAAEAAYADYREVRKGGRLR